MGQVRAQPAGKHTHTYIMLLVTCDLDACLVGARRGTCELGMQASVHTQSGTGDLDACSAGA
jgi:hypothetical protein